MSISLNNHESRITALENTGITSPAVLATNTFGTAIKLGGLVIQGGWFNNQGLFDRDITLPKTFNKVYAVAVSGSQGTITPSTTKISIKDTGFGFSPKPNMLSWIAIGILYTYRYIIKSAQKFTPLSYLFNKEV